VGRYPLRFRLIYRFSVLFFDRLCPLLALGRPARAARLDDEAFARVMQWIQEQPLALVRVLFMLVTQPMMEVLAAEPPPEHREHPLAATPPRPQPPREQLDVLVIGSGAGGAPVAWKLATAGARVALVEQGTLVTPLTAAQAIERYYVVQGMTASLAGHAVLVSAGSTVGGSTSINSGTCLRPLPEQLRLWDEEWGTDFAGGALDPWLADAERLIGVETPSEALQSKSGRLFQQGLAALGREGSYILPRNAPGCEASGRCCFGCPPGAKRSTDRAFLVPAVEAGLLLYRGATARGIWEERDGVSVSVELPEGRILLRARHLVIAAGALFTPGLLRRSRLGAHWRRAGGHLRIHPAMKVMAYFPGLAHGERGIPQGIGYRNAEMPRLTFEGVHTPPSVTAPLLNFAGRRFPWWWARHEDLASFGVMLRERGFGRVVEQRGIPMMLYRLRWEDAWDLRRGLLFLAEVFLAAGAERVLLPVAGGECAEVTDRRDLAPGSTRAFNPEQLAVIGFHPQGTAGIGRVVEPDLQLAGSARISVCDASVLPDSPGVNPQMTIMALSLRLAQRLLGEL
jgi:hypothetical protein